MIIMELCPCRGLFQEGCRGVPLVLMLTHVLVAARDCHHARAPDALCHHARTRNALERLSLTPCRLPPCSAIHAVSFSAPPSLTRRDMAVGFGAAAAAMIQVGPAFAESATEKKQRERAELEKTLASFAKTTQEDKEVREHTRNESYDWSASADARP